MNFRTDLALERKEYVQKEKLDGIKEEKKEVKGIKITTITITNDEGEKKLSKPKGKYITVEMGSFMKNADLFSDKLMVLRDEIISLLPKEGDVLVVGLGNEKITPDALGPKCISLILATRHITEEFAKSIGFEKLRSVAAIVPGVLGVTGIETAESIVGVAEKIKPSCIIVIDALAARSTERLGTTVQITDTGVSPGSGVGNKRSRIDKESVGVPVIAVGVPTVVDAVTMTTDVLENAGMNEAEIDYIMKNRDEKKLMMVTPKEIDNVIDRAASLVAMAINSALQPDIPPEDILAIVS
jgi:spore protease